MIIPANAKYKIIQETMGLHGNRLTISALCEIAGVSRSGYYHYLSTEEIRSQREERKRSSGFSSYCRGIPTPGV